MWRGALRARSVAQSDDGDDGRKAQPVRRDPDPERSGELHHRAARRVLYLCERQQREAAKHIAGDQAAYGRQQDRRNGVAQHDRTERRRNRQAVDQEGGGIVEQALALQDGGDAVRHLELPEHGGCRHRIRRRDDGAERDCRRDRQAGHLPADEGNHHCGEDDSAKRQQQKRQPVALQVAQRGVISCIEKHRRDEQRKCQFRIDLDRWRARHEGNPYPGQGQQGRIGDLQLSRQCRQRNGGQKQDKGEFEKGHGLLLQWDGSAGADKHAECG